MSQDVGGGDTPPGAAAQSRRRRGVRNLSESAGKRCGACGVGDVHACPTGWTGWSEAHVGFAGAGLRWRPYRQFSDVICLGLILPADMMFLRSLCSATAAANNTACRPSPDCRASWLRQRHLRIGAGRAYCTGTPASTGRPFIAHVRLSLIPSQLCGEVR